MKHSEKELEQIAEARRAYNREWRRKNREKVNAYHAAWREANSDKIKQYSDEYWLKKAKRKNDE